MLPASQRTPNNFRVCAQQKCLIREMLQNVPYFWNTKTQIFLLFFIVAIPPKDANMIFFIRSAYTQPYFYF